MESLAGTLAFVFALVALGYLSGWSGLLKKDTGAALTDFAVSVALPLLLFRTMARADFAGSLPAALWLCYFTAVAFTWITAHFVIVRFFGRDTRAGIVGGLSAGFSNLVLLGFPFLLGLYGQEGFEVLSLIVSVHLPIMIGTTVLLFGLFGRSENGGMGLAAIVRDFLVKLLTNSLIIGILAGLIWRFSGLGMPPLMERLVDALANVAGTIALFAMGLELRRYGISGNVRPAAAMTGLKLVLMPAVALAMAKLVGLPPLSGKVVVTAAALPCGVNPYLIAVRFGTGQALASNATTIGTPLAALSTAFWVAMAEWVFG